MCLIDVIGSTNMLHFTYSLSTISTVVVSRFFLCCYVVQCKALSSLVTSSVFFVLFCFVFFPWLQLVPPIKTLWLSANENKKDKLRSFRHFLYIFLIRTKMLFKTLSCKMKISKSPKWYPNKSIFSLELQEKIRI